MQRKKKRKVFHKLPYLFVKNILQTEKKENFLSLKGCFKRYLQFTDIVLKSGRLSTVSLISAIRWAFIVVTSCSFLKITFF